VTTSTGEPSVLASASTSTIHEPRVIGSVIGQTLDRTIEPFRRPGAGPKMVGTPYSMGGIVTPNTPHPCSFVPSLVVQTASMNWSQMNFPVFYGSNPKVWRNRCETYFEFYVVPSEMWIKLAIMHFQGPALYWL
jgi:hypothetical protein